MRTVLFSPLNLATLAAKQETTAMAQVCHNQLLLQGSAEPHYISEHKWRRVVNTEEVIALSKTLPIRQNWERCQKHIRTMNPDVLLFYFPDREEGIPTETVALAAWAAQNNARLHILVNSRNEDYSILLWELFALRKTPPRFLHHISELARNLVAA